jgi:hypothetical protein
MVRARHAESLPSIRLADTANKPIPQRGTGSDSERRCDTASGVVA